MSGNIVMSLSGPAYRGRLPGTSYQNAVPARRAPAAAPVARAATSRPDSQQAVSQPTWTVILSQRHLAISRAGRQRTSWASAPRSHVLYLTMRRDDA
jgi:hypothetical protein